ncbi:MAG: hypothetical protein WEA04_01635 [Candidatus Andersenbacteria bacterium]
MRHGRYGTSHLLLRLGLGLTFLWIGIDMWRHPDMWIGYLPTSLPLGMSREDGLKLTALLDVAIGILLIVNKFPRATALLASLHLAGILIIHGIDAVTIRDVGLFGLSLALLFWPQHGYRKHWWQRLFKRRRRGEFEE